MRKTEMQTRALNEWGTLTNGQPRMVILHHYRGVEWLAEFTSVGYNDEPEVTRYLIKPRRGVGAQVRTIPEKTPRPKRRSRAAEVVEAYIPESKLLAGHYGEGVLHIHTAECEVLKDPDAPLFVVEEFDDPMEMARCWFENTQFNGRTRWVAEHTVIEPCVV